LRANFLSIRRTYLLYACLTVLQVFWPQNLGSAACTRLRLLAEILVDCLLYFDNIVCLGVMSAEKQGNCKSELSPDGGLKLTIKREKPEDASRPQWVTEARGSGLGKLVIKRKSSASAPQSHTTAGLHVDRQSEPRPILRLSLTSNAANDGNRHVQVKSWSLCEVLSAVEDARSVSELSPSSQQQQSPKDSGIDMSSPPHDDAAVSVEPNTGTGVWSISDSSAVEEEKTTGGVEKLETAIHSFVGTDNTVHASSGKTLWPNANLYATESNHRKLQSMLRSRGKHSALKAFPTNSQKLVNPLAKSHRVGRYQHMLPVHRIRAESNVSRRSSLEESPTYNMVASRNSLFSQLPRVKTKLKLVSNNVYTPVFDHEVGGNKQHADAETSPCLNVTKSNDAVVKHKRNRLSFQSAASSKFENMKVKLCFGDKNRRSSRDIYKTQKLPKLKLVVKSEPPLSVSCVEQQLEDVSVVAADKHSEENVMPRHQPRKRRHHDVGKTKAFGDKDLRHSVDSFNGSHLSSSKVVDVGSRPKRKSSEESRTAVSRPEKKSEVRSCAEQLGSHLPMSSDSRQLVGDSSDEAVQPVDGDTPVVLNTNKLSNDQSVGGDQSSEEYVTGEEIALRSSCTSVDQSKLSTQSAELESDVTDCGSVESSREKHPSEGADCEKSTLLSNLLTNNDVDRCKVDEQFEAELSLSDADEELLTTVQHDITSASTPACVRDVVISDESHMTFASVSSDNRLTTDTTTDLSEKSHYPCVDADSLSAAADQLTAVCSDTVVVPLSSSPLLADDNSVTENSVDASMTHCQDSGNNTAEVCSLTSILEPAVDTASCDDVDSSMVEIRPFESSELNGQQTECEQSSTQEVAVPIELKLVCSTSDTDQMPGSKELEHSDSDSAYLFDMPSDLLPITAPNCSKEHTEITPPNGACSSGFLAAFTQFVKKASDKSSSCKRAKAVESTKEMLSEFGADSKQKCVQHKLYSSQTRHRPCPRKQRLSETRSVPPVVQQQNVECVSSETPSLPETCSPEDIDCSERLTVTAVHSGRLVLSRDELQNIVESDRQLLTLRYRTCELIETVLPEYRFPPGFRRDSASVERLVNDITEILSNSEAPMKDARQCSDPVVLLHRVPDQCLQSLQQRVVGLLSLLLPDTDLSDVGGDSLEIFLELLTSVNRPLPGAFRVTQPNLCLSTETCTQPSTELQQQSQSSSSFDAETNLSREQTEQTSLSRTESQESAADMLFPSSSLLQLNLPASAGDKRSIRRQVKDCLMLLDRDLT